MTLKFFPYIHVLNIFMTFSFQKSIFKLSLFTFSFKYIKYKTFSFFRYSDNFISILEKKVTICHDLCNKLKIVEKRHCVASLLH